MPAPKHKTKNRRRKPSKAHYVIRKVDPVQHAEDIQRLLRVGFSLEASGPTAFLGVSFWLAYCVKDGFEEAVGVAGMCHSAIEEGSFYLNRSAVHGDHRGHGLQRALIKARVQRARELKGTFATSDTYDNPHSANNLIGCGFRAYKPEVSWRIEGTMYWRLAL